MTEFLTIIACMIEEQEHKIQALHIPELQPFVVVCQIHLSGLCHKGTVSSLIIFKLVTVSKAGSFDTEQLLSDSRITLVKEL